MSEIGDGETLKLFDSKGSSVSLHFFEDLAKLEFNSQKIEPRYRTNTRLPVGISSKKLGPIIKARRESKADVGKPFSLGCTQRPVLGKE